MRNYLVRAAAVLIGVVALQGPAAAQVTVNPPVGPGPRPALSPYLNLLRGGNPAANYYLGVLPEFDRRNFEARMSAQPGLPTTPAAAPDREEFFPTLPQTGHATGFGVYSPYYSFPTPQRPYYPQNGAGGRR